MLPIVLIAGCGRIGFAPLDGDASVDALVLGPWSTPVPISGADVPALNEQDVGAASSKLELYFTIGLDIYVMTRPTPSDPWGPKQLFVLSSASTDSGPRLSPDDLTFYFDSNRPGGVGGEDMWTATRTAIDQPWAPPTHMPELSTGDADKWFSPCLDGRYLIVRDVSGNDDIFEGQIGGGPATPVAVFNTPSQETGVFLTFDCATAYYGGRRGGGSSDIFVAQRAADGSWESPTVLPIISTSDNEADPWISPDQRLFIFARGGSAKDLYESTR